MLRADDRGQSIQIGAILLFGVLILGLSSTQAFVVPQENKGVEFTGYVEATDDLTRFHDDVLAAGTRGAQSGQAIQSGVLYPTRVVLINPGPPTGAVRTTPPENVTLSGIEAVSGEDTNTREFWNLTERGSQNYSTTALRFDPAYNELDAQPVVVTGGGVYRLTDAEPLPVAGPTFLSGNRLTFVTLAGDVSTAGVSTTLTATPESVTTQSVTVTGAGGSDFTVTLPVAGGNATQWNQSSAAQRVRANPHVVDTVVNGSRVDVTFRGDRRYELRLARVVVHESNSGAAVQPNPAYVTAVTPSGTGVPTTGTRSVTVEVRDRYNNPVSGATVRFSATDGEVDGEGTSTDVTGSDGRASTQFDIADTTTTASVTAALVDTGVAPYNETTIELTRSGAGDGSGDINPAGANDLSLVDATINGDAVDVEFENLDTNSSKTIVDTKVSFYSVDSTSESGVNPPESVEIDGESTASTTVNVGGDFGALGETFGPGAPETVTFTFKASADGGGSTYSPDEGDFFILVAQLDTDGDSDADSSVTYFVGLVGGGGGGGPP